MPGPFPYKTVVEPTLIQNSPRDFESCLNETRFLALCFPTEFLHLYCGLIHEIMKLPVFLNLSSYIFTVILFFVRLLTLHDPYFTLCAYCPLNDTIFARAIQSEGLSIPWHHTQGQSCPGSL